MFQIIEEVLSEHGMGTREEGKYVYVSSGVLLLGLSI